MTQALTFYDDYNLASYYYKEEVEALTAIPTDFDLYYRATLSYTKNKKIAFSVTKQQLWRLWEYRWANRKAYRLSRKDITKGFTMDNIDIVKYEEFARELMLRHQDPNPPGIKDFHTWCDPRKVAIYGTEYYSLGEAMKATGKSKSTIRHRCSSPNFPEWEYLDPPRYQAA